MLTDSLSRGLYLEQSVCTSTGVDFSIAHHVRDVPWIFWKSVCAADAGPTHILSDDTQVFRATSMQLRMVL